MHYDTIISFIELPDVEFEFVPVIFACFSVSLTSRRNNDKF